MTAVITHTVQMALSKCLTLEWKSGYGTGPSQLSGDRDELTMTAVITHTVQMAISKCLTLEWKSGYGTGPNQF